MGIVSQAVKAYKKAKASKTARGAEKTRMKEEYEREGRSETSATNKANYDMRKAEGKTTAAEKTDVKQSSKDSKFIAADTVGGNKTLALQKKSTGMGETPGGQFVKINKKEDEMSPTRKAAYRQRIRNVGEKMYESGLKESAKKDLKKVGAAGAGGAAAIAASAGSSKGEDKKSATETRASKEDTRVNPKDFPTYQKKTESAAEFRKAFSKAKDAGKDTFTFEGRTYKTEDGMKGMKMMGGGMAKKYAVGGVATKAKKMMGGGMGTMKYAVGGMANCGASMKPSGGSRNK